MYFAGVLPQARGQYMNFIRYPFLAYGQNKQRFRHDLRRHACDCNQNFFHFPLPTSTNADMIADRAVFSCCLRRILRTLSVHKFFSKKCSNESCAVFAESGHESVGALFISPKNLYQDIFTATSASWCTTVRNNFSAKSAK